jgi:homoserine dehydrogenase
VGSVKPVEVPITSLPATIDGTSSYVSITTDLMGKVSIVEHAPEIEQTGYGILIDLINLIDCL